MPLPSPGKILSRLMRFAMLAILAVACLAVIVVTALYLPPVQDWAKDYALRKVAEATGMDITAQTVRLRPPLRLELGDITAVEASGDTLATLAHADIDMMLLPLISGSAEIDRAIINGVSYRLGTPDSAMHLLADIDTLSLSDASYSFRRSIIDARGPLLLAGARVKLLMNDSVDQPVDTAVSQPLEMLILAREIEMRSVNFTMSMMPAIDTLHAFIPMARLSNGRIDMASQQIHARSLSVDSITASYIYPLASSTTAPDTADVETTSSAPWTVTADNVKLTARRGLYALAGAKPIPGLDMDYLEVTDVDIEVDSLYNRQTAVRVPLRRLLATERSGLSLNASGLFDMDSAAMRASDFRISTGRSLINLNALMGVGDLTSDPSLPLSLQANAEISPLDIITAFPAFAPMLKPISPTPARVTALINGSSGKINLDTLAIALPSIAHLKASGSIDNPFSPDKICGKVALNGAIEGGANRLKSVFLDPATAKSINIEPTTLSGNIDYSPGLVDGNLIAMTRAGHLNLDARWAMKAEDYKASLSLSHFPLQAFMPSLGIADISANLEAQGHGYNPIRPSTEINARVGINSVSLNNRQLHDIVLAAELSDGEARGNLSSSNPDAELDADFAATITPHGYTWDITGDIYNLNLTALGLSNSPMGGSLSLASAGEMSTDIKNINATLDITDLDLSMGADRFTADSILISLAADSVTQAHLHSASLDINAHAPIPVMTLASSLAAISPFIDTCMTAKKLDVIGLQHTLPPIEATLTSGRHNPLTSYLAESANTTWDTLSLEFTNDSLLHLKASALALAVGATRIDTISFDANQKGKHLVFSTSMNERPGTMDNFAHVNLTGFIANDKLSVMLRQRNIKGDEGFHLGMNVTATDSTISLAFVPRKPIIGYRQWAINPDNFVTLNFASHFISANLALQGEQSRLRLYTLNETERQDQEDIVLQLDSIHIQDWLSISPFAPPMKGDLGADMRFHLERERITGQGIASLTDLYYGRERVGSFNLDLDIANSRSGSLAARVGLDVDSVRVITAQGALNDSTLSNPFLLDFSMIRFPLKTVNPFLPKEYARLDGTLSGHMDITGTMTEPIFNGNLTFDSASCRVGMLGQAFSFSPDSIPVDSNVVRFDGFKIRAANDNPLVINGLVDMRAISNPRFNLNLVAHEMQIINSSRPRGADAYGKAFIDLSADIVGSMQFANVDADLDILPGTNVTYIMTDAESRITNQSAGDMVRFVVLSDTGFVAKADSIAPTMNLNLEARLNIHSGSTIAVDLSSDGKNKVQVQPQGNLTYTQNPMNDGRLTGRLNINQGFARYTPPLMSEKLFNFQEGSYIAFNGDMMNPILNIHAVDELRANVTRSGEDSRLVNFDVALGVTGSLSQMNVAFDLSTNDDITVQNELQSMSPEQRANQAMNLLLYNVYTGQGTRATANLSGNPLYAFLSSQLNSWMANNIKGVDITFGIDQYDKTQGGNTSTATSYSYRISKNLFNDRFKIIVGGNYTTDANADENFSQNLINDISFEYMLNRSGSMYVRIFRHTGYESILEGEITQTGVGFVVKRKLNTLRNLFRFIPGVKPKTVTTAPAVSEGKD
ncbi:MAG: translocation/assembly module TamB domain-containing protein [Pseudoflavonifractor sp.]|nr:translocation/assembly module TamB domain-containing protein [Alloprevotella sp.]MCM1116441.1 translocation/assembly module TamB domain-containing protein [Pseudoflavonifractor sp.]